MVLYCFISIFNGRVRRAGLVAALIASFVSSSARAIMTPPRTIAINQLSENDRRKQVGASSGVVDFISADGHVNMCNTFVIDQDTIMTNHHCIPEKRSAIVARFNVNTEGESRISQRCERVLGGNSALDYALVRCPGIGGKVRPVAVDLKNVRKDDRVFSVTHFFEKQTCRNDLHCKTSKAVTEGNAVTKERNVEIRRGDEVFKVEQLIQTTAYGQPGTSGSAFYSMNGHAIGLLNSGDRNEAAFIPINRVVEDARKRFPQIAFQIAAEDGASASTPNLAGATPAKAVSESDTEVARVPAEELSTSSSLSSSAEPSRSTDSANDSDFGGSSRRVAIDSSSDCNHKNETYGGGTKSGSGSLSSMIGSILPFVAVAGLAAGGMYMLSQNSKTQQDAQAAAVAQGFTPGPGVQPLAFNSGISSVPNVTRGRVRAPANAASTLQSTKRTTIVPRAIVRARR